MQELFDKIADERVPNTFPRRELPIQLPVEAHHFSDDQRDALSGIIQTIVNILLALVLRKK